MTLISEVRRCRLTDKQKKKLAKQEVFGKYQTHCRIFMKVNRKDLS